MRWPAPLALLVLLAASSSADDTNSTTASTGGPTTAAPTEAPKTPTTLNPAAPTEAPTEAPKTPTTLNPAAPTEAPTEAPTAAPTEAPTTPTTLNPAAPTVTGTQSTTLQPTTQPTTQPPPVADQVAQLPLDLSAEPCARSSCALGQMVADGVRTAVNRPAGATKWADAVRTVIIPAATFASGASLPAGALTKAALLKVLASEAETVCKVELAGSVLADKINLMLNATDNGGFPQVSGLWVYFDVTEGQVVDLWVEAPALGRQLLQQDAKVKVALPCGYAADPLKLTDGVETTGVKLQDVLTALYTSDNQNMLVPPVVELRVKPYIAFPSQADLCEDWTGMTVAYTLLVLGAVIMVGYQGYQFWRFRSTLSYVR